MGHWGRGFEGSLVPGHCEVSISTICRDALLMQASCLITHEIRTNGAKRLQLLPPRLACLVSCHRDGKQLSHQLPQLLPPRDLFLYWHWNGGMLIERSVCPGIHIPRFLGELSEVHRNMISSFRRKDQSSKSSNTSCLSSQSWEVGD